MLSRCNEFSVVHARLENRFKTPVRVQVVIQYAGTQCATLDLTNSDEQRITTQNKVLVIRGKSITEIVAKARRYLPFVASVTIQIQVGLRTWSGTVPTDARSPERITDLFRTIIKGITT